MSDDAPPSPAAPPGRYRRQLLRNTAATALANGWTILLTLVALPLMLRGLGTAAFGVWALLQTFSAVTGWLSLADLGMGVAATRGVADRAAVEDHDGVETWSAPPSPSPPPSASRAPSSCSCSARPSPGEICMPGHDPWPTCASPWCPSPPRCCSSSSAPSLGRASMGCSASTGAGRSTRCAAPS
ncbi:MAG: hypothetical protein U0P45_10240 [Acidimicrobiales bacterium]